LGGVPEAPTRFLAGLYEDLVPFRKDVIGTHEIGVAARLDIELAVLQVAAGFEAGEGLGVEARPVVDAAGEVAQVDKIEVVGFPAPVELGVVDEEAAVRGDPGRLDR